MKKVLLGILLSSVAYGATTGNVTLKGVVPNVVSITVTGVGTYNNLDLTATQSNLTVANVQEQSNDSLGYKVTVASTNAGKLLNGVNNVTYTARYNTTPFTLSTTAVQITNVTSQTTVVNVTKVLDISYVGTPSINMMSGNYTDTLTFTITAN